MAERKNKKKMNVYLKGVVILLVAGFCGGVCGGFIGAFEPDMNGVFQAISTWLNQNNSILMSILAVLSIAVALVCYRKCEGFIKEEQNIEDEQQDMMDRKFDLWATVGTMGTSIIIGLVLIIFPFSFSTIGPNIFHIIVPMLITSVVIITYQSLAVRQMKRRDPMKKGDATDFRFQQEWIESCDEAERRIIYQASYKSMGFVRVFIMGCMVVAMFGHLFWETGLTAVVLLGAVYLASIIPYCVYTLKLQAAKLDN